MAWMGDRKAVLARSHAEHAAWMDFIARMSRDDPDWGFYYPDEPRPRLAWWRRWLRLPPREIEDSITRRPSR